MEGGGRGKISVQPTLRLRAFLLAQAVWLTTICLLGGWWGHVVLRQASQIEILESKAGISPLDAHAHWSRTQRMLFWESSTFFLLVLTSTGIMLWLYWREAIRTRGLQAFFASVAHELRTPLTSIRLQAEAIADAVTTPPEKKWVERLLEDTGRFEAQIERTLELARLETGGTVYVKVISLSDWLDYFSCQYDQQKKFHTGYPEFRVSGEADGQSQKIMADPVALQVIFRNLIENTARHASGDSKESGWVEARFPKNSGLGPDWISVQVSDHGKYCDVSPKKAGELFERGQRSRGAGVGLYLIQSLMRRMGGRCEFRAESGLRVELSFRKAIS